MRDEIVVKIFNKSKAQNTYTCRLQQRAQEQKLKREKTFSV